MRRFRLASSGFLATPTHSTRGSPRGGKWPSPLSVSSNGQGRHGGERLGDVVHRAVVHVADEAQGEVLLLGRQPAHVAEPLGERLERLLDRLGQVQRDEQTGHRDHLVDDPALV